MELGIGTAQFGLDYGVSNRHGRSAPEAVDAILALAVDAGVTLVDTAADYGQSEAVLGAAASNVSRFRIVTKTPSFRVAVIGATECRALRSTLKRSLECLKVESLWGLLVHHCEDLLGPGGERLYETLAELKAAGLVAKIGVSVYDARQIEHILEAFTVDLVQVPLNILDQRLVQGGQLRAIASAGARIHVRSAFLQGLLLMEPGTLPPYFESARARLCRLRAETDAAGVSPLAAALGFVRMQPEVDGVIVGVTTPEELAEIVAAFRAPVPDGLDYAGYAIADERIIDPRRWELAP